MPIVIDIAQGPLTINESTIQAVARQAELAADLVAAFLEAMGVFPKGEPLCLPPGFLLELGAGLQLTYWEQAGVRLPDDAPTAEEAKIELATKIKEDPGQFRSASDAPLHRRVFAMWLKHFGWDARAILQADVIVGEIDEDALVEALAGLLWEHRDDDLHTRGSRGDPT